MLIFFGCKQYHGLVVARIKAKIRVERDSFVVCSYGSTTIQHIPFFYMKECVMNQVVGFSVFFYFLKKLFKCCSDLVIVDGLSFLRHVFTTP